MATAYLGSLDTKEKRAYSRQLAIVGEATAGAIEDFKRKCKELSSAYPNRVFSVCDVLRAMGS